MMTITVPIKLKWSADSNPLHRRPKTANVRKLCVCVGGTFCPQTSRKSMRFNYNALKPLNGVDMSAKKYGILRLPLAKKIDNL